MFATLVLVACLNCGYSTPEEKLEYQHRVYDTLLVHDMYIKNLPEPLPVTEPDRLNLEKVLPYPYPNKDYPDQQLINPKNYIGDKK